MFAAANTQPQLLRAQLTSASLLRITLDPLLIILTLFAVTSVLGEAFEGPYLILTLLVFSLTFPGSAPIASSTGALLREVLVSWTVVAAILVLLGWATHTMQLFPARVMLWWGMTVPFVLFTAHRLTPVLLPRVMAVEGMQRTAVIAGAGDIGHKLAKQFRDSPFMGIRLVGYFDDREPARLGDLKSTPLLGKMSALPDFARANRIDLIYISLPMASQPRILNLLEGLRDTTASVYFTPDIFLFDLIQARMDSIGEVPVVAVCETPFYGVNALIKRLSDLVIATLILLMIAPVLLVIAAAVKLTSPGPVLFKQRRYGLDGREIIVYKFRSMTVCEDGGEIRQATKNDMRITRLGAFLRKSSLDELPQFINVLQGRMSVVGPRPHAVAHNEQYRKLIRGYMVRHKVKPGITGWAQVNGLRGETDTLEKMKGRIEYDLAYLRNWTLRFDLEIILKTVLVVLRDRNAY
jgi:putative colanic acid biosynthesis UDP-glucose lipid carrier transferase